MPTETPTAPSQPLASFADIVGSEIDTIGNSSASSKPEATTITTSASETASAKSPSELPKTAISDFKDTSAGNEFDPKIEALPDVFKKETAKETPKPVEEPTLPKEATPAVSAAFQKITGDLKAEREKLKTYETKLAELEAKQSKSVNPDEIAKFQKRIEEYEAKLKVVNLDASPEYNEQITTPKLKLASDLEILAKANDLDSDSFLKAAAIEDPVERRKKINSITKDLSQSDAFEARKAIDGLLELKAKDDSLRKDISTTIKVMEEQREKAAKEFQERSIADTLRSYQETFKEFTENGPVYFRKSAENEGWNKSLEQIYSTALAVENTELSSKQKAQLTMQAVSFPVMRQMFDTYVAKSNEEISNLRAQLQKYAAASPSSGPASAGNGANASEPLDKSLGLVAALEAGLR
jgi:hypothetical protein